MSIDTQAIKNLLQREAVESENEEEFLLRTGEKLENILRNEDSTFSASTIDKVRAFAAANDINRRKLLAFCEKFIDPTAHKQSNAHGGTAKSLHFSIKKSELYQLADFINLHQNDNAFCETVYRMMDLHGMSAPQVYKNAKLRRQDFARAVSFSGEYHATKRITWQIIIGLHCTLEEADEILYSAGYLRRKNATDLIMEYFIKNQNYDIEDINYALQEFGLKEFPCWEPNVSSVK